MAPKQEPKWRRKLVQPVDGAAQTPIPNPPPFDGALQPPQVAQPPVPVSDPPPSSPAVVGSSSADRNQPSPSGTQHPLQQGNTGRSPRGRSYHPHPSRGRGRGRQPPPVDGAAQPSTPDPPPVDGALQAPQVAQPPVPDPPSSSPAVIGSSSAGQNQPSPLSPPPGTLQQGSTGRSYHPPPRGTQEIPPGSSASPHRSPPLPPLHRAGQHQQQQPSNNNSSLANSLLEILRGFILDGEKCALYKAEVASLARRGCSVLTVDFEHLLTNIDLAVAIGNDNDSSYLWLRSAVRAFFNEQCNEMKNGQRKKFVEGASVSFSNKPVEVFPLTEVKAKKEDLVQVIKIIRGQETCRAASTFGTEAYLAILLFVIGKHRVGQSWDGDFAEQDVYFFRYLGRPLECRILKSTTPNPVALSKRDSFNLEQCTPLERKNDFGTVDVLMTPNYEDADGNLPVFLDELHEDLTDSLPSTVVQEWFMENLEFNLALMSSAARKILTVAISNLIRSLKLSSKEDYDRILMESPYPKDWRVKFQDDEGVMGGVYWYENEERNKEKDQYKDTMDSVIEYEKNIHDHCHEYLEGEKRIDDFDESELLIAVKLPGVLGKLVKDLMRLNLMKGMLAEVRGIYCSSRSAQKEPAAAMLYVHDEVHGTQNETTEQSGEP